MTIEVSLLLSGVAIFQWQQASTQSWHWKTDATCQAATDQETDQAIIQLYHTEQQRQRHSLDM